MSPPHPLLGEGMRTVIKFDPGSAIEVWTSPRGGHKGKDCDSRERSRVLVGGLAGMEEDKLPHHNVDIAGAASLALSCTFTELSGAFEPHQSTVVSIRTCGGQLHAI